MRKLHFLVIVALAVMLGALAAAPASASTDGGTRLRHMRINYLSFHPNRATVKPGTEIDVTNLDGLREGIPHSVTADDGSFDTDPFTDYATFFAPLTPGSYPYHCEIHPFMHGMLIVAQP
jgi:plastocyanin